MNTEPSILTPIIRERIEAIIRWLESGGDDGIQFNMTKWNAVDHLAANDWPITPKTVCGTVACMGGYAELQARFNDEFMARHPGVAGADLVRHWLSMPYRAENTLCMGRGAGTLERIDTTWAIRTLRHLLETGIVDWNVTKPEGWEWSFNNPVVAYVIPDAE